MLLCFRNRQQTRAVNLRLLREITVCLLKEILREQNFELCIHLVAAREMAKLNETFLHHHGSTDVITFDYTNEDRTGSPLPAATGAMKAVPPVLQGEIFISIDDTVKQARAFRATWQSELIRYVVHGILHLKGFDDMILAERKKMKREENRLLSELSSRFTLSKLHRQIKTSV